MKRNLSIKFHPEGSSSEIVMNFPKIYWIPSDVAPAKTYQGGHWFDLRKSNCQQERLVRVSNSEFKVPQDLANTNNCLTKLNHSKTTPAVITTTSQPSRDLAHTSSSVTNSK